MEDAIGDVREWLDQQQKSVELMEVCLGCGLEGRADQRHLLTVLFQSLLLNGLMTSATFLEGLAVVVDMEEDIIVDVPKMWIYLAEMVAPLVRQQLIDTSQLHAKLRALIVV